MIKGRAKNIPGAAGTCIPAMECPAVWSRGAEREKDESFNNYLCESWIAHMDTTTSHEYLSTICILDLELDI